MMAKAGGEGKDNEGEGDVTYLCNFIVERPERRVPKPRSGILHGRNIVSGLFDLIEDFQYRNYSLQPHDEFFPLNSDYAGVYTCHVHTGDCEASSVNLTPTTETLSASMKEMTSWWALDVWNHTSCSGNKIAFDGIWNGISPSSMERDERDGPHLPVETLTLEIPFFLFDHWHIKSTFRGIP